MKKFSPVIILSVFCLLAFSAYKLFEEKIEFYHLNFKANGGDYIAQNNLGVIYEIGEGVPQDYKEAVKWYRKAAEQGFAKGQYNLGRSYHNGQGVPQDYKEAFKWYTKAAEQGFAKPRTTSV